MSKRRSAPSPPNPALERKRRLQTLRAKLEGERSAWNRWTTRLKRAFHSIEQHDDERYEGNFTVPNCNTVQPRKEQPVDDPTEAIRRQRLAEINAEPGGREALEAQFGKVWDTSELGRDFQVIGFAAPLVVVCRRADGVRGSLEFQHGPPRLYFNWLPHEGG